MIDVKRCAALLAALAVVGLGIADVWAQRGGGQGAGAPPAVSGRAAAPVDFVGYWVSVVTEDWRFRMVTPPKGDYASVPLNAEGRRVADTWDPSKDGMCDAYGAAAIMRMPGRVRFTWEDDDTLKIETDAGQQTRLLHFRGTAPAGGDKTPQGYSVAQWVGGAAPGLGGFGGFGGNVATPDLANRGGGANAAPDARGAAPAAPGGRGAGPNPGAPAGLRWGVLRVVTTGLRPGWLRKNGVPYSANTTLTENFMRFTDGTDVWFTVTTTVEDPTYLAQPFITSSNFKREADASKWKPVPCRAS
jgi:hypothetical protein